MFACLLAALDDDLLSQDYPYSPDEAAAASRVKDALHVQCISQIAIHWFKAMFLYRSSDPALAAAVLDTMRRYIPWIDITLIANDAFIPLLFDIILQSPCGPTWPRPITSHAELGPWAKIFEPDMARINRSCWHGSVRVGPCLPMDGTAGAQL